MNDLSNNVMSVLRAAEMIDNPHTNPNHNDMLGHVIEAVVDCINMHGDCEDQRVTADALLRTVATVRSLVSDSEGHDAAMAVLDDIQDQAGAVASSG